MRSHSDPPDLPEHRTLKVDNTTSLNGISRYPRLINLASYGYHRDAQSLADLQEPASETQRSRLRNYCPCKDSGTELYANAKKSELAG